MLLVIFSFTNYIKLGKQNEFNFDNMIVDFNLTDRIKSCGFHDDFQERV